MRRVEFRTFLQGGAQKGHKVFISTASLGDASAELLLRVNLNGHVFDAEAWPAQDHHVIEVPADVLDSLRMRAGDAADVAIERMGA